VLELERSVGVGVTAGLSLGELDVDEFEYAADRKSISGEFWISHPRSDYKCSWGFCRGAVLSNTRMTYLKHHIRSPHVLPPELNITVYAA